MKSCYVACCDTSRCKEEEEEEEKEEEEENEDEEEERWLHICNGSLHIVTRHVAYCYLPTHSHAHVLSLTHAPY